MDNYDKSVYEKARNAEAAIRQLKDKNKARVEQIRNRAKVIGNKILEKYPNKFQCISYTNDFEFYASDLDSIPMIDASINFEGDMVSVSTYSFGRGEMVPLFWFTVNFLWDELF